MRARCAAAVQHSAGRFPQIAQKRDVHRDFGNAVPDRRACRLWAAKWRPHSNVDSGAGHRRPPTRCPAHWMRNYLEPGAIDRRLSALGELFQREQAVCSRITASSNQDNAIAASSAGFV